jgi:glucan phosphorylase
MLTFGLSSQVVTQSIAPVWNEVLAIENVEVFDIGDDQQPDCAAITMFLYDDDKQKVIRQTITFDPN